MLPPSNLEDTHQEPADPTPVKWAGDSDEVRFACRPGNLLDLDSESDSESGA
jgi:hypothetical protein